MSINISITIGDGTETRSRAPVAYPLAHQGYLLDSILPYRRWLLVTRSADFADFGPTLACQPLLGFDLSIFCRRWANVGSTADFCSRWQRAIIGDLGKQEKNYLLWYIQKSYFSEPKILTNHLIILDIKIIFSL